MSSILFVITSLDFGGAEVQVVALASELVRRGWKVRLASLLEPKAFAEELCDAGISAESLGMKRGVADPRGISRLARIIREFRPDLVHSHMVHANILARLTRVVAPVPYLISTAHSVSEGGRLRELAYRYTDRLCDLTTSVSVAGAERYVEVGATFPGRSQYFPNGIDTSIFQRSMKDRVRLRTELGLGEGFVWLAVGSLSAHKDYPNMLRAMSLVDSDSTLLIAGQGDLREELEALANSLGIRHRVQFLGLRRDIIALASVADSFLMSSSLEGMPLALLEAAACGLPAVATDIGGMPQIVSDKSGTLVPPHDSAALALAMTQFEGLTAAVRAEMGAAARRHVVSTFDLGSVVSGWEEIYQRGIRRAGGKRLPYALGDGRKNPGL